MASDIGIIGRSPVFRGDPDHLAQYNQCSRPRDSSGFMAASLGEGNGTPLHYSCLDNPMDR